MKKDVVIKVEGLSKQYSIGKRDSYLTLRDKLMELPNKLFKREKKPIFWALKNISFEVKRGEVLGVIGRNGAGKSTLLKILARITEPTSGKITMKGRVASMLEVGTGFNPELTGRENIYLNGSILGMSRSEIQTKFAEITEFAGIGKFLDTPVKRYSSGMYVRLAFSVAAHLDSDILIVDEVLAVGDTEFQKKCLGKMDNLAKSGRTVIYVSHNISSILSLCHKAIYLDSGKLLKVGKTSTTLDHYYRDTHKSSFDHEVHQKFPKENQMQLSTISSEYMKNTVLIKGKLKSERVIDNNSIGISIHSESGQLLGLLYSGPECYYQFKKGKNEFSLQISNINFTPGRYYIRMRIESRGEEIYWPKDDVSNFNITYLPDKMTGRSEIYSNGLTLLESDWK